MAHAKPTAGESAAERIARIRAEKKAAGEAAAKVVGLGVKESELDKTAQQQLLDAQRHSANSDKAGTDAQELLGKAALRQEANASQVEALEARRRAEAARLGLGQ